MKTPKAKSAAPQRDYLLRVLSLSCRSRHCPKCQGNSRLRWLQARERELLPASYVHVVFTMPRELAPLALQNKRLIYNLLFHSSAATLIP